MGAADYLQASYSLRYRARRARGETAYVDAEPARLHLATLLGVGWSLRSVAGVAEVALSTVSKIHRGEHRTARPEAVARILAVRPDQIADRTVDGGDPFVSAVGTRRRIRALLVMGWPHHEQLARSGVRTAVTLNQAGLWVTRSKRDAVATMYRDLSRRQGPSRVTAARAAAAGYLGPGAWDDIDHDPEPDIWDDTDDVEDDDVDLVAVERRMAGDRTVHLNRAERRELVRRWVDTGRELTECERLTGIHERTLHRDLSDGRQAS